MHRVVVHASIGSAGPVDIAVSHAHVLRSDPGTIGQQTAGDDTIIEGNVVVSGCELDAIAHGPDHLVIVNVAKGRGLLRAVVRGYPRS